MRAWMCLFIALAFASTASATTREVRKRISIAEKQLDQIHDAHTLIRLIAANGPRDGRGRTKLEDIEQWAYTAALDTNVKQLLSDARTADEAVANAALENAQKQLDLAARQAMAISSYWEHKAAVSWRDRWNQWAKANGVPAEPYDERILDAERTVQHYLNSGDFVGASSAAVSIDTQLQSAIDRASFQLAQSKPSASLQFIPRSTPCPAAGAAAAAKASITRAADPADYYPAASKRRDEQGSIIVRVHVNPASCATGFAVVASSGFPELDQAAIRVAEASRYAPATEDGAPVESELTFKVRFLLTN
jgi:TonB family protein